jgi:hypothetical protein
MPRPRREKARKLTQGEQDSLDVLDFLRKFPCMEFSRKEIARGSGVPDNHRIFAAVPRARLAAAYSGARLEQYQPSQDPAKRGAYTLRFIPAGKGDELGARDALRSSRIGITAMEDMRRASEFESKNSRSSSAKGFGQVANAVGGCLSTVESIQELNAELWRANREKLELAKRVAALEAEQAAARDT